MPELLTRKGARNLTEAIDRIASTVQLHAAELGLDPRIAFDYAKRSDMISDAVESTAATNFPIQAGDGGDKEPADAKALADDADPKSDDQNTKPNATSGDKMAAPEFAQPPKDETGLSVEPGGASGPGWDPNAIADDRGGPYKQEGDEPYMSGEFAQKQFHELRDKQEAGLIPGVDKFSAAIDAHLKVLAARPEYSVQGYDGFTDQIRAITPLTDQIAELSAAIEAAAGPLISERSGLEKDYKKKVDEVKKTYKAQLSAIGDVTIERKTSLVEARARLKVDAVKRSLNEVQAELLAAVTEKYGAEAALFISKTQDALRDLDKNMRITIEGFELEQRVMSKTGSAKEAGLVDVLGKFHSYFDRAWKKLVQMANTALSIVTSAGKSMGKAHADFMGVLNDIQTGKIAGKIPDALKDHQFKKKDDKKDDEDEEGKKKAARRPDVINIFA